jgi:hypothetical protein
VADEPCIHCRERHPTTTAFCPNTGKALAAHSGPSAPVGPQTTAPAPPSRATADEMPAATGGKAAGARPSHKIPSWVTEPQQAPNPDDGDEAVVDPGLVQDEQGVLDLLQRAFALYKNNAKLLITVAAVVFVPGALVHACARAAILAPTIAISVALDPVTGLPVSAPFAVSTVVAGFTAVLLGLLATAVTGLFLHGIIVPLTHGALAIAAADRIAGGNASWREIWKWLFRRLGTVLSAIIPAALLIGAGFFFLVVPGLILAFFFAFVPTIALFEGVGGTAALRRSFVLVRSDWLRMLLIMIVFGIIAALAQFVAGMMSAGLFGTRFLQDALTLIAMPIPVLGSVLLYFDARRKHDPDGFTEQQLANEMEGIRRG